VPVGEDGGVCGIHKVRRCAAQHHHSAVLHPVQRRQPLLQRLAQRVEQRRHQAQRHHRPRPATTATWRVRRPRCYTR